VGERHLFVLRYGPGSLVTREKPALAAARVLFEDHCIPLAVVTTGRDAELLEPATGKVLATGMEAIPARQQAAELIEQYQCQPPAAEAERERPLRILNAFDLQVCCRGDSCKLP
jgi:hypothetical protein